MEKYKKYYGVMIFGAVALACVLGAYYLITPQITERTSSEASLQQKKQELEGKQAERTRVINKLKQLKDSIAGSQKKIYSPVESDLGNDTLFFTLYNDLIEMIHSNSVKIKSIDYSYNPASDKFVEFGKDVYFVCDVDMELVSNYVNLGKLVQDIYQYPYYIKINEMDIKPYEKDKTVLVTNMSLRLYAHTAPQEEEAAPAAEAGTPDLGL
ncbi:MAG: type 4a pilus biogenesis protein PilO [Candidatus Gastranaerophilales bacterium]|nr:type 4a pilus biogenesis protein PilO [Candidatus Gastranaerophilales bacterium]MCM1073352.1 type 4a pilus biogenesis protein PilO [Bacteroides sp.]